MSDLPTAHSVTHAHHADEHVTLGYDERFLRRKVLVSEAGLRFLVDLGHTTSLGAGDAFRLEDGRLVEVIPAPEALYEIRGDLTRLAWHVGNRHTPCQIEADRLLIQRDHVMAEMLARLGAEVAEITLPFTPEGGAYGHGRTQGHDHGSSHSHSHGPGPDHRPEQGPEHGPDHRHAR